MASGNIYRHTPVTEKAPYSSIATIYDRIMAHVDYNAWFKLIQEIIAHYLHGKKPSVLEVGGGSGVLGRILTSHGLRYLGSDLCLSMCEQARSRGLPFICADARNLPLKQQFDLVIFLYDGINYLLESSDYTRFFTEAHRCLNDGGLLLFDVTTETNSLKHFFDFLDFEDFDNCAYVRHSYFDSTGHFQHNDFTIFSSTDGQKTFTKQCEHHVQKVLSVSELKQVIAGTPFEIVGIWDGYTTKKYSSRSDRIHFLLRKNGRT